MPQLEALHNKYKDKKFLLLAINTSESAATIKDFMTANKCTFTSLVSENTDVPQKYEIKYVPTNFIINKSGIVKHMSVGSREADKWDGIIEKLLAE